MSNTDSAAGMSEKGFFFFPFWKGHVTSPRTGIQEAQASPSPSPQSIVAAAHVSESLPVSGSFIKTAPALLAPLRAHKMAAYKTPPDRR